MHGSGPQAIAASATTSDGCGLMNALLLSGWEGATGVLGWKG